MRRTRPSRRLGRPAVAGLTVATGLALAACGVANPVGPSTGAGSVTPAATPAGRTASPGAAAGVTAPLTGLAAGAAGAARPAVALVVSGSDPSGIASADVVFEEMSNPVRYIAVFQSRQATGVGPITSTQPTDREVLSVLHPLTGYDGAQAGYFIKLLDKSKIKDVGYAGHGSLYTAAGQGLTTSTRQISDAVRGDPAPPSLFQYQGAASGGETLAATGVSRPTSVRVALPGHGTQEWSFDSHANRWVLTHGGPRAQAANVVVQIVSYKQIGVNRRAGIVVSSAQVIGGGRAEVFSGSASGSTSGTAAAGTWSKPRGNDVTNYLGSGGSAMAFTPGPTWVILAPTGTHISTSG